MPLRARVTRRHRSPPPSGRRLRLLCEPLERRGMLSASWPRVAAADHDAFSAGPHDDHAAHEHAAPTLDCAAFPRWDLVDVELPPLPIAPLASTFKLHSRPSAAHVIYLDFDGHTTQDTWWNRTYNDDEDFTTPAYSIDASPAFSNQELANIQDIWARVAEDFAPFDVDVTTEAPPLDRLRRTGAKDTQWGVRIVVGGSCTQWYKPDVSGAAYHGSFTWDTDTPGFVFEEECANGSPYATALTTSHEIGHALDLRHDGRTMAGEEYYRGHGDGPTRWRPIMGGGRDAGVAQWSRGEYADASNTEDDLAIITSRNGFGYRPDEYGNTLATASFVPTPHGSAVVRGVITQASDVDVLRFFTWDKVKVTVGHEAKMPNLDVLARIWNAAGQVVQTSNPPERLDASFDLMLPPGFYSLAIRGTGKGTASDGYTAYGSIGPYKVTLQTNPQPPRVAIAATSAQQAEGHAGSKAFGFTVTRSGSTTGTTTATWSVIKAGGTATADDFAGGLLPSGKATFVPGQTTALVNVFVAGNHVLEPNETFVVRLTQVTAGSIATATAVGTILNDDLFRTALVIAAASARRSEGNAASTPFVFTVTRSGTLAGTHTVAWSVAAVGNTPAGADDFVGNTVPKGVITFAPDETVKKITLLVRGDTAVEPDEAFTVRLSNPVGEAVGIAVDVAGGVISNDDKAIAS